MSKRHTTSRRRTYGRRQHELHERLDRRTERVRVERTWRAGQDAGPGLDALGYLDAPASEPPFGFAD
jgi:hypothetical protein